MFLRAVRRAADLEQEQLPGGPPPQLTSATIADAVSLPAAGRADLVRRLGAILRVQPWGWLAAGHGDEGWYLTSDRRVRRLRGVATIADYWAAKTREEPATPTRPRRPSGPIKLAHDNHTGERHGETPSSAAPQCGLNVACRRRRPCSIAGRRSVSTRRPRRFAGNSTCTHTCTPRPVGRSAVTIVSRMVT